MKTSFLIIVVAVGIGLTSVFSTAFYLQGISSGQQQDMCMESFGKWDYEHETCDRVDPVSCTLMNGIYQECKSHDLKCPLNNPNCVTTASCISTCLFEQTTRTKTMTDEEKMLVDVFLSPPSGIKICNDSLGKPDGECFLKSYDDCEPAIIKQSLRSVEGDLVFSYAQVLPDSCTISFVFDDRYDKYGSHKSITEQICQDAQISDDTLIFLCGDDGHSYGFPLR